MSMCEHTRTLYSASPSGEERLPFTPSPHPHRPYPQHAPSARALGTERVHTSAVTLVPTEIRSHTMENAADSGVRHYDCTAIEEREQRKKVTAAISALDTGQGTSIKVLVQS